MLNKIISVVINIVFPKNHLQLYLENCSFIQFESKLTPRIQKHDRMFYPFYYKDPFVRDCILELKERNSYFIAIFFAKILSRWIIRKIFEEQITQKIIYLVPVPQHISKTKEKGFCHTTTLTDQISRRISHTHPEIRCALFSCIQKIKSIQKLHNTQNKRKRFNIIKKTMQTTITKYDSEHAYFFIIDDVFTTGATFKETRRSLKDCAVPDEHIFFVSIAH